MPQSGIVKYHVKLSYEVDGLVERADIIGAIFGQTEGLLGPEMNLNELQRVSKVGRIEVSARTTANTTAGDALIPMSTDIDTCALIAAGIESIDKVGPFDCKFTLEAIDDVRAAKKDDIVKRAKEIKQKWATKTVSEGESMLNDVHQGDSKKLTTYGPSKLTCSSGLADSNWVILVEGRADVINLLRAGYDNALAIEGAKIDESIKELCNSKDTVVAFLDGDRSGGFILKELKSVVPIDYELRADNDVEVEELTPQRIDEILSPIAEEIKGGKPAAPTLQNEDDKPLAEMAAKVFPTLNETLEAVALDSDNNEIFKVPISEVVSKLSTQSGIKYLLLDGIITQRLLEGAKNAGIECVVGHRVAKLSNSDGMTLKTFGDLGVA
ncbi:DNA primase protein [Marine Group I thaumarchaeote SCGC AAA799-E16]|uniref:DNA primase DnaG n=4 Tax=Marine Group I TaxID=905826 RepID=A0A081RM44_9ARCH|nr:DNA primase protein [Marine Group I thaumarchaeote SCGC AAA799-N04]KER06161.1 DNA primase protein [Marine Group I thaumarchaeote SCGC AAA799-E16]KFM15544.1 DNA primase protein [Marine Group I thaumarchaeote SCGC AAA799-D11]KFM19225.1 DNA primase protein [Marine Group I thaumarchaeote SCGC RSA3]